MGNPAGQVREISRRKWSTVPIPQRSRDRNQSYSLIGFNHMAVVFIGSYISRGDNGEKGEFTRIN